jgi:chromatin remodeling complex protein RSC6
MTLETRWFRSGGWEEDDRRSCESHCKGGAFALYQGSNSEEGVMLEPKKSGNNALQRPLKPSPELAAITGSGNIARSDVVSKMWDYIKKNNLQNPQNKREIMADAKLKPIFGGKDKVSMFEMNKHLSNHLSQP